MTSLPKVFEIRQKVEEILKDKVSLVDSRVFRSRPQAIWDAVDLPCVCVYSASESVETFDDHGKIAHRFHVLSVEILDALNKDLDLSLDKIKAQVESALMDYKHHTTKDWQMIQITSVEWGLSAQGTRPIGACRINFQFHYEEKF